MNVIRANKKLLGMLLGVALCFGMGNAISAQYSIKVAYENNPGEPADLVMHRWADLVKEASGGKVALELYPSSQLGAKLQGSELTLIIQLMQLV